MSGHYRVDYHVVRSGYEALYDVHEALGKVRAHADVQVRALVPTAASPHMSGVQNALLTSREGVRTNIEAQVVHLEIEFRALLSAIYQAMSNFEESDAAAAAELFARGAALTSSATEVMGNAGFQYVGNGRIEPIVPR